MEDVVKIMNIIYEDNHIIVVEKEINVPVQEDDTETLDLVSMIKSYLKEKYDKPGNVYLGLLHRLDRPVGGVMLFAKTSKAASRLSDQIKARRFEKSYYAVVEGEVEERATLIDKLYKNVKTNAVVIDDKGKETVLDYRLLDSRRELSLVDVELKSGRSHQVRVQFSSRNCPLHGDQKYNPTAKEGEQIALFLYSLSFEHPITKENLCFELPIPTRHPFDLFKLEV